MNRRRVTRPQRPRNPELPFAKALSAWSARQRLSQTAIAKELRLTHRTVNRWMLGRAAPRPEVMARLVAFAARFDVEEARALAVAGGAESLTRSIAGLAAPPEAKASPEPPAPQLSLRSLANAIACEAADTLGVPAREVRPALLAAFQEARRIGATFDAIIAGLEEASEAKRP